MAREEGIEITITTHFLKTFHQSDYFVIFSMEYFFVFEYQIIFVKIGGVEWLLSVLVRLLRYDQHDQHDQQMIRMDNDD